MKHGREKGNKRPLPAIRRYRRAALGEMALILLLMALTAVILARRLTGERPREVSPLFAESTPPVHVFTMAPEPTPGVRYGVELEPGFQRYIMDLCGEYGLDPALVMALIQTESGCDPLARGDEGASVGLMQICGACHRERMERLGVSDLTDPAGNVLVGVDYLAELMAEGRGEAWALMAYNGGAAYADELDREGIRSAYARRILALREVLEESAWTG